MNILCWRKKQRHLSTVFPIVTLAFIIRCDRQHSIFVSFRIVNNIEVWLLNIALIPLAHRDIKRLGTTKYNCRCCCCHLQCRATICKHVDVWDTINWHIRLTFFFFVVLSLIFRFFVPNSTKINWPDCQNSFATLLVVWVLPITLAPVWPKLYTAQLKLIRRKSDYKVYRI